MRSELFSLDRRPQTVRRLVLPVVILVALIPWLAGTSDYDVGVLVIILVYGLGAVSLNLTLGFGGEFALGQVVAIGAAAYATGLLNVHLGWGLEETIIPAVAVGVMVGVLLALPGLRLKGWPLAFTGFISVLAFTPVVQLTGRWSGGTTGLVGVKPPTFFGVHLGDDAMYLVVVAISILMWGGMRNLVRSPIGYRFQIHRDAPRAAESLGLNIYRTKLLIYVLSSVPAALAGWLLLSVDQFIAPSQVSFNFLVVLFAGVLIGGQGTVWGPLVGTAIIGILTFAIGPFSSWNELVLGIAIVVVVAGFPRGLTPPLSAAGRWLGVIPPVVSLPLATGATGAREEGRRSQGIAPVEPVLAPAAASGSVALQVRDLTKSFGGIQVLDGVDLTMRVGWLTGLVGPNGSGKTTLLNIISGFFPADDGTITLADDQPCTGLRPHQMAERLVARTFQVPLLALGLTVRENVEIGMLRTEPTSVFGALVRLPAWRRRQRDREARALGFCAQLGLDSVADMKVGSLPLGLRRLVEIARAIASGATVIFMDEPASGLNPDEVELLGEALDRLRPSHAILLIEHNVRFVLAHSDDINLLQSGRVVSHAVLRDGGQLPEVVRRYADGEPLDEATGAPEVDVEDLGLLTTDSSGGLFPAPTLVDDAHGGAAS